jgi:hypothetical protein
MAPYSQGPGGAVYNAVGTSASQEANTPNNPDGIVSTGAVDPSLFRFPCPMDGLPCRIVGSQQNCFRCDNAHQWSMGSNGLFYQPYIFDNKIAPVVPTTIPPTLG